MYLPLPTGAPPLEDLGRWDDVDDSRFLLAADVCVANEQKKARHRKLRLTEDMRRWKME